MSSGFKPIPRSFIINTKSNGEVIDCVYNDSTGKSYTVPYELYERVERCSRQAGGRGMQIGKIYEITSHIQISWGDILPIGTYYAKCIGFNSKNEPVYEGEGKYFSITEEHAIIKELKQEIEG